MQKKRIDDDSFIAKEKDYEASPSQSKQNALVKSELESNAVSFGYAELLLLKLVDINRTVANEAVEDSIHTSANVLLQSIVAIIIASVLSLSFGLLISRMILRPVRKLNSDLYQLATSGGDLTQRFEVGSKDEIGKMTQPVNDFIKVYMKLFRL